MSIYNPAVPTGLINLDTDYQNLQNNFQQLDTTFSIDHFAFSDQTTKNGYHTIIHQPPNGGLVPVNPAPIAGIGQLYVKNVTVGITTDTQLFFETGLGGVSQLTGNSATANGYQWVGGMLFQWGFIAPANSITKTVTFATPPNIDFPNNIFNVSVTPMRTGSSNPGNTFVYFVDNTTVMKTGFTIKDYTTHTYGFYWTAIGN